MEPLPKFVARLRELWEMNERDWDQCLTETFEDEIAAWSRGQTSLDERIFALIGDSGLAWTHSRIAAELGVWRESVSLAIRRLEDRGRIHRARSAGRRALWRYYRGYGPAPPRRRTVADRVLDHLASQRSGALTSHARIAEAIGSKRHSVRDAIRALAYRGKVRVVTSGPPGSVYALPRPQRSEE